MRRAAHHSISVSSVVGATNDIRRSSEVSASCIDLDSPTAAISANATTVPMTLEQNAHVAAVGNDPARVGTAVSSRASGP